MRLEAVLAALAVVTLGAVTLEALWLTSSRRYDWRAALASLSLALARQLTELTPLWLVLPGGRWLYAHRVVELKSAVAQYALLFFGLELAQYWIHRLSHRVRWLWATHAVHHTARELNLSVGYRLGVTGRFTLGVALLSPLCALGFSPETVTVGFSLHVLAQFWVHAGWMPKLGFVEGILNTPSAHRVHHATHPEYRDKNFGGALVVFDRLFGTYAPERDGVPLVYGLTPQLRSENPVRIAFHEWVRLWRDARRAGTTRAVLRCLLGPPSRGEELDALEAPESGALLGVRSQFERDDPRPGDLAVLAGERVLVAAGTGLLPLREPQ
jgi:sterol desaturase/sphingolipid hydroxylase (fatty acid hydroxylase superfamily)